MAKIHKVKILQQTKDKKGHIQKKSIGDLDEREASTEHKLLGTSSNIQHFRYWKTCGIVQKRTSGKLCVNFRD